MSMPFLPHARRLAGAAAATALLAAAGSGAHAAAIYSNFDPTVMSGPGVDFSSTESADISGYCNSVWCSWINVFSAGFSFTPDATGVATRAFLPLDAQWEYGGAGAAERFYRISIFNTAGELVVQGGLLGRYVPIAGGPAVYEFSLTRDYEAGQDLADSDELVAGQTYQAYFFQRYGRMAQTQWMKSNQTAAPGQAYTQCATNVGGYCAYWDNGWQYPIGPSYTQAMTGLLPALALTDGAGYVAPAPNGSVPEPATLALVGLALAALGGRRPRRG